MNKNWNNSLAQVIQSLNSPGFSKSLANALRTIVEFDYTVVFAYYKDVRPIDLYDDFPAKKRRVYVTMYQEGPYLLDPFFLTCAKNIEPDLYRLKELAPDRFYQSEYYRSYYSQTGLAEEIGYFVKLPGGVTTVISLMRSERSAIFSAREFRSLKEVAPIVCALATQQWSSLHQQFSDYKDQSNKTSIQRRIDHAFLTFGNNVLTKREREVVEYVLKGYSSSAIGEVLKISRGTVQIHRKNIYTKLGINSQGALFSQFIRGLTL